MHNAIGQGLMHRLMYGLFLVLFKGILLTSTRDLNDEGFSLNYTFLNLKDTNYIISSHLRELQFYDASQESGVLMDR